MMFLLNALSLLVYLRASLAQSSPFPSPLPNSFPQVYPGEPSGDLSPEWQSYFEVDATQLPNISFPLPRSFAGNVPVDRPDHPNNTIFFWAFETADGSLTADTSADPWLIWLQGGPGSSSLAGMVLENGPFLIQSDLSMKENNFSWNRLADVVWVDQPVGTGYSTADSTGYVADDDQMADDFLRFLANFVKVFPGLATRPLYITGESYAGHWIPYITKAIFSTPAPPVNLAKIAIGDGSLGSFSAQTDLPVISLLETYPHLVSYDAQVLDYFRTQHHLCGYDLNLTYPQTGGHFPSLQAPSATDPNSPLFFNSSSPPSHHRSAYVREKQAKTRALMNLAMSPPRQRWVRRAGGNENTLAGRANGTIDSWYACNLLEEVLEFAVNFTFPWNTGADSVNVYDAADALNPKPANDFALQLDPVFFVDNRTRAAIHAPTSKSWEESITYPFLANVTTGTDSTAVAGFDPSVEPQAFFDDLAANATERGVHVVLYSGNNDVLVPHRSTEVAIQNTTFGGTQGFSRKPATPWYDDDGNFAGVIHQERNWTYALFQDASHLVPASKPAAAFVFLRDFILGNKTTGLVSTDASGSVSVVGGEATSLAGDFLPPETAAVYYGSLVTQSTITYPAATVSAWDAVVIGVRNAAAAAPSGRASAAVVVGGAVGLRAVAAVVGVVGAEIVLL